jgi:predicted RND superfamily exporter protein
VFVYFCFHLRSGFLAFVGITIVLFSFPLTVVIAKAITIKYFTTLHMLMIFIVLGIAADDIFVFYDAWRQSGLIKEFEGNNKKRMAYTFRRSSRAMFMTSSTTAAAFLANIFSPIMPIKSFGIYSGIIVPLNFIMTVTMFPSATIIYETYFAKCCNF